MTLVIGVRVSVVTLFGAALLLSAPISEARGHGGGGHGGGGHGGGGHSSGGHSSGGHSGGSGGFATSGGHAFGSISSPSGGNGFHASFRGESMSSHGTETYSSASTTSHAAGETMYGRGHDEYASQFTRPWTPPVVHDVRPVSSNATTTSTRISTSNATSNAALAWTRGSQGGPVHVTGLVRMRSGGTMTAVAWSAPRRAWHVPTHYHRYYAPYQSYASVSYWVTDSVMIDLLAEEEARLMEYGGDAAVADPEPDEPLPADVREELREEMDGELPGGDATSPDEAKIDAAMRDRRHLFVVSRDLPVVAGDATCTLTRADIVRATAPIATDASYANVLVVAAKTGSCAKGTLVTLAVSDLRAFEHDLIARVNRGTADAISDAGAEANTRAQDAASEL